MGSQACRGGGRRPMGHHANMFRSFRLCRPGAVLMAVLALSCALASAQDGRRRGNGTVFRCERGGSTTYSDVEQRCPGGQTTRTAPPAASGPIVDPNVTRLTRPGPLCPLPVPDPEGAVWEPVRACYQRALKIQPNQLASEAQLAGAVMGQCEAETSAVAYGKADQALLGRTADERRLSLRLWAQWLVHESGKAIDSVPVQVVDLGGRPGVIARLSGPMELQKPDGTVVEALNGTLARPGSQLYVRPGVSFLLGGVPVSAVYKRERCVRVD
jgi:hypothetical protein